MLRKQSEVDRITAAVRSPDAGEGRELINGDALSIQAGATGHGDSRIKSESDLMVGSRDRLLSGEQLMAPEFGPHFLAQRLAAGGPVVAEFLHPLDPDIVEMGLIGWRTVSGFQLKCPA
jgi:hypothetical protein